VLPTDFVVTIVVVCYCIFIVVVISRRGSDKFTVRQKDVHPHSGLHFLSFNEENWEKSWDRNDSKSLFFVVVLERNFNKGTRV